MSRIIPVNEGESFRRRIAPAAYGGKMKAGRMDRAEVRSWTNVARRSLRPVDEADCLSEGAPSDRRIATKGVL
jgi:hypothetical protein